MEEQNVDTLTVDELERLQEDAHEEYAGLQRDLLEARSLLSKARFDKAGQKAESSLQAFFESTCQRVQKRLDYGIEIAEGVHQFALTTKRRYDLINETTEKLTKYADRTITAYSACITKLNGQKATILEKKRLQEEIDQAEAERFHARKTSALNNYEQCRDNLERLCAHLRAKNADFKAKIEESQAEEEERAVKMRELCEEEGDLTAELQCTQADCESEEETATGKEAELVEAEAAVALSSEEQAMGEVEDSALAQDLHAMEEGVRGAGEKIEEVEGRVEEETALLESEEESLASLRALDVADEGSAKEEALRAKLAGPKEELEAAVSSQRFIVSELTNRSIRQQMRIDVMDDMFGEHRERTIEQWRVLVEETQTASMSSMELAGQRDEARARIERLKRDQEVNQKEATVAANDLHTFKAKLRNLRRRVEEGKEHRQTNLKLAHQRQSYTRKQIEDLQKAGDAYSIHVADGSEAVLNDGMVTPAAPQRRPSRPPGVRKGGVGEGPGQGGGGGNSTSRGISDDSDGEIVTRTVYPWPPVPSCPVPHPHPPSTDESLLPPPTATMTQPSGHAHPGHGYRNPHHPHNVAFFAALDVAASQPVMPLCQSIPSGTMLGGTTTECTDTVREEEEEEEKGRGERKRGGEDRGNGDETMEMDEEAATTARIESWTREAVESESSSSSGKLVATRFPDRLFLESDRGSSVPSSVGVPPATVSEVPPMRVEEGEEEEEGRDRSPLDETMESDTGDLDLTRMFEDHQESEHPTVSVSLLPPDESSRDVNETMESDMGDLDVSGMLPPPQLRVFSPPPARQVTAPVPSIFANDSESDGDQSIWGDGDL